MVKLAIVIPALNEREAIASVVAAALGHATDVIVVDDGSTDGTGDVAREAGALVVRNEQNEGVGASVAKGLTLARSRGADIVVQLDGDGQHDASCVPELIAAMHSGANLVVGTRFERGFPMSAPRRVVTRAFGWAVSRRLGWPVSDPTSGFRAFDATAIDTLCPIFPRAYLSDTVELLLIAAEHGLRVTAVPVRMFERSSGNASVGPIKGAGFAIRMALILLRHSRLGRWRR